MMVSVDILNLLSYVLYFSYNIRRKREEKNYQTAIYPLKTSTSLSHIVCDFQKNCGMWV